MTIENAFLSSIQQTPGSREDERQRMANETTDNPFASLSSRSPYSWLRERDVDLLVCAELHADGGLTRLFRSRLGLEAAHFVWARVSHAEFDGESDLVIAFESGETTVIAHVENKIAAEFQPDQVLRYRARSQRWATMEGISHSITVLLAPDHYMTRPGSEGFDVRISYEEASEALCSDSDPRAKFLADALVAGVEACRRQYVMNPDQTVSALWQGCWLIASRVAPDLNFAQPGLKPRGGTWPSFPEAKGFSREDARRVSLIFKMERGQVDLQFSGTTVEDLRRRCVGKLRGDMTIEPANKSASIRVMVPKIDFSGTAEGQEAALIQGFAGCESLRTLFEAHRSQLLQIN